MVIKKYFNLADVERPEVLDLSVLSVDTQSTADRVASVASAMLSRDKNLNTLVGSWKANGYAFIGIRYPEGSYGVSYLCKSYGTFPSCTDRVKDLLEDYNRANPKKEMGSYWSYISITSYEEGVVYVTIGHPSQSVLLKVQDFDNPTIEPDYPCTEIPEEYKEICKEVPFIINTSLNAWSKKSDENLFEIDVLVPLYEDGIRINKFLLGISNAMSDDSKYYEDNTKVGTYRMAYIYY